MRCEEKTERMREIYSNQNNVLVGNDMVCFSFERSSQCTCGGKRAWKTIPKQQLLSDGYAVDRLCWTKPVFWSILMESVASSVEVVKGGGLSSASGRLLIIEELVFL